MTNGKTGGHPDLKMVNPNAAAIDIGSTMHMAAVNPDADTMPVRAFGTFTRDLHDLANWFQRCGVTTIAIESTGVYWIAQITIITDRMRYYTCCLEGVGDSRSQGDWGWLYKRAESTHLRAPGENITLSNRLNRGPCAKVRIPLMLWRTHKAAKGQRRSFRCCVL